MHLVIPKSVKGLVIFLWLVFAGGCRDSSSSGPVIDPSGLVYMKPVDASASAGIVLDGNYVYFQTTDGSIPGKLYRISKEGSEIITFDAGGQSFGVPTITSSSIVTTSTTAGLRVYDKSTRQLRWSKGNFRWLAIATADESSVYVTDLDRIQAFSLSDGTLLWQTPIVGKNAYNPVIDGDRLYFGTGGILLQAGYLYCINKNNGAIVFQDTLPYIEGRNQFGGTAAGAEVFGSRVLIPSNNRYLYCFDKNNGALVWRFLADAPMETPPRVRDGIVFLGSLNRTCFAIDAQDGNLLWSYQGEASIKRVPPTFHGDRVSFTSGSLIVLDRTSGSKVVEYSVNNGRYGFWTAVFDSNGKLYCTGWEENSPNHWFLVYQF